MDPQSLETGSYRKYVVDEKVDGKVDVIDDKKDTKAIDEEKMPQSEQKVPYKDEKWWQTTVQVAPAFIIAGFGTMTAGVILGHVKVTRIISTIRDKS